MCMVDMVSMVFQPNLENNFLLNIRKTMLTMHQSTWSTWSFQPNMEMHFPLTIKTPCRPC